MKGVGLVPERERVDLKGGVGWQKRPNNFALDFSPNDEDSPLIHKAGVFHLLEALISCLVS